MGWALTYWSDFEGQTKLAGIDWKELDGAELVSVCYSLVINDIINFETSRVEARKIINERLDEINRQYKIQRGEKIEPEPFVLSPDVMAQMGIPIHRPGASNDSSW